MESSRRADPDAGYGQRTAGSYERLQRENERLRAENGQLRAALRQVRSHTVTSEAKRVIDSLVRRG